MAKTKFYLALDLGAESGRAVVASFDGAKIALEEIHRFPNAPVRLPDGMHWDILRQFAEVKLGIAKAVQKCGAGLVSMGLDTWGVDFGLLDKHGGLLGNPWHYRDSRTDGMYKQAFKRVKREQIFAATGIQFMEINTLYQVLSMVISKSPQLAAAHRLLMVPDLLNYWLTGKQVSEMTIASTSQLYDPKRGDWSRALAKKLGIPPKILPKIVQPGAILGSVLPAVAEETGAKHVKVVAPGCHDTACAVAAVPAESDSYVYLSSGTWSLMGIETRGAVINEKSLRYNFTNEGGVCGTIRLLKNITGLWLVQECRRTWAAQGEELNYAQIAQIAEAAPPFTAMVNPDEPQFVKPGDMPARITEYCKRTGQKVPADKGQTIRTALETLALKYRWTFERLEELAGRRLDVLHIVGGGTQNKLLNQMAADCVGRPVVTGPVEATAVGNVLMQMVAMKDIKSLAEGRAIVRKSFETQVYEPRRSREWDAAYAKFVELTK
jgi:rhamnulokinase